MKNLIPFSNLQGKYLAITVYVIYGILKQSPAFSFGIWIIDAHGKYVEYQELWIADDNFWQVGGGGTQVPSHMPCFNTPIDSFFHKFSIFANEPSRILPNNLSKIIHFFLHINHWFWCHN